jgi:hypothetical protein
LKTVRYESLLRSTRKKSHGLRRHALLSTRKAIALSVLATAVSFVVSLQTGDWNWFARSGSLVVVIGIFLTSSQIIENSRNLRARRARRARNFDHDYAEELKQQSLSRSRSLDEDLWENGLRGLYLLVIGTLIWGYGDLIGTLLQGF